MALGAGGIVFPPLFIVAAAIGACPPRHLPRDLARPLPHRQHMCTWTWLGCCRNLLGLGSPSRFGAKQHWLGLPVAPLPQLSLSTDPPQCHIHCRSDAFRSIRGGCAAGLVGVGATAAIDATVHGLCPNCRLGSSSAIAGTAPPGADAGTEYAWRAADHCSDPVGEEGPRSLMAGPISPRDHHTGTACARVGSTQACSADAQPQVGSSPCADHQHAHTHARAHSQRQTHSRSHVCTRRMRAGLDGASFVRIHQNERSILRKWSAGACSP